jgi:predicted phosphodiesterase
MKIWRIIWLAAMVTVVGWGIFSIFLERTPGLVKVENLMPVPTLNEKMVRIAVMADIHNDVGQLEIMLNKAKENGVEMVVVAGDLTIEGKRSELNRVKKVLDSVDLKYAVVPGNHEYYLDEFIKVFGKNYQSIRLGEVKLILVDNSYWQGMDELQKRWLASEVNECGVLICVAIMHKPLNNVLSTHVMGENNKKVAAEAIWLRDLLISSGVRQIEAGHLHYASSYELEGIRTDIVGAISRDRNNQSPRYTELLIGRNYIERKVVEETNDIGN